MMAMMLAYKFARLGISDRLELEHSKESGRGFSHDCIIAMSSASSLHLRLSTDEFVLACGTSVSLAPCHALFLTFDQGLFSRRKPSVISSHTDFGLLFITALLYKMSMIAGRGLLSPTPTPVSRARLRHVEESRGAGMQRVVHLYDMYDNDANHCYRNWYSAHHRDGLLDND